MKNKFDLAKIHVYPAIVMAITKNEEIVFSVYRSGEYTQKRFQQTLTMTYSEVYVFTDKKIVYIDDEKIKVIYNKEITGFSTNRSGTMLEIYLASGKSILIEMCFDMIAFIDRLQSYWG